MGDPRQIFIDEASELLENIEEYLLQLELDILNHELIDALFRDIHTLKGAAGVMEFENVVRFTHQMEELMAKLQRKEIESTKEIVGLFLYSVDELKLLISHELNPNDANAEAINNAVEEVVKKYLAILSPGADLKGISTEPELDVLDEILSMAESDSGVFIQSNEQKQGWFLHINCDEKLFERGIDLIRTLGQLKELGEISDIYFDRTKIPNFSEFDPEKCYFSLFIVLESLCSRNELSEVTEFLSQTSKVVEIPLNISSNQWLDFCLESENPEYIADILVSFSLLSSEEKNSLAAAEISEAAPPPGANESKQLSARPITPVARQNAIRVDIDKLSSLVNLVGELVIYSARATEFTKHINDKRVNDAMEGLEKLVEEIRDVSISLRMVPIGETFNRFKRVIRDLSAKLGKEVDLHLEGIDTELDKTVTEKIIDPITHIIRNSLDHGIESPDARESAGKNRKGKITLKATHESGNIIILISDDGAGLNVEKIKDKALEKNLVANIDGLSDEQIRLLIFEPGFSTADTASDISGRGVGMDVVKKNIEGLRGHIDIDSIEGKGTTFKIKIPLTMAIIDGFVVRIGSVHYVVPLDDVQECIDYSQIQWQQACDKTYIDLRDTMLPLIRLHEYFDLPRDENAVEKIIVVRDGDKVSGFVVDQLVGEYQTVIKPLGRLFEKCTGISGATILGSGEVAMIIDAPSIMRQVQVSSVAEVNS